MASASKEKEVSSVPTEDGSIAEMQEEPEILQKLRDTECSLLLERTLDSNTILHLVANSGHVQTVEMILSIQQCRELLTAKNSSGDLPLHVAANAGHLSIVKHFVNSSHQCQDLLMAKNSNEDLPIHVAANAGHLSIVKYLFCLSCKYPDLLTGKNPDIPSKRQQQKDLTSTLLRKRNKEGNTPLHLALIRKYEEVDVKVKSKYNEVAKFLIENDPIVFEDANKAGKSPRDMASKAQDTVLWNFMLNKFVEIGADPTSQGAATSDLLLDERSTSTDSSTDTMVKGDRRNRKSKDKVTSMKGELYEAVKLHNITRIQKLIEQDLENSALSDKTPELNTILHLAAASSDDDQFVEAILRIQICQQFVTEKNSSGDLPLHVAASAGNLHIVKLLVKWSNKQLQDHSTCRPEREKNIEGNTPLHLALIKKIQVGRNLTLKAKYNDVAGFLVRNDPQVSYFPNKEHKSPLYMAAEAGDAELVKLMINKVPLLPYGESIVHSAIYYLTTVINLQNGKSIVHTAICGSFTKKNSSFLCPPMCLNRHTDILDTVLKSLPDDILTMKDDKDMTPLFYAASIGYLDGVEILLKKPTKCCAYDQRDTDGYYPIHIASRKGHIEVVEKFLKEYPDMIELLTDEGQNILHLAAMNGKEKVVAYMLKKPDLKVEMLINNGDENGNTPLHLAAEKGHPKVVCFLTWDKRVDLKALNKKGKRALDVVLSYRGKNHSFGERLTWEALRYVSGPRENPQSSKVEKTLSTDKYQERTDTLLLVATLVATVTFAAAFTMPGGYNGPGGMATFLEKPMFQVFVISNTIAMYSAITAVIALIWAQLGDHKLFIAAYKFGLPILGLAITMVSLAFMAGNYLVLRNVNWLAYLVLSIGSLFLFTLSIIFFPLFLPNSSPHPIIRYLLRYPFYLLIMFTRCDTDDREGE